MISYLNTELE